LGGRSDFSVNHRCSRVHGVMGPRPGRQTGAAQVAPAFRRGGGDERSGERLPRTPVDQGVKHGVARLRLSFALKPPSLRRDGVGTPPTAGRTVRNGTASKKRPHDGLGRPRATRGKRRLVGCEPRVWYHVFRRLARGKKPYVSGGIGLYHTTISVSWAAHDRQTAGNDVRAESRCGIGLCLRGLRVLKGRASKTCAPVSGFPRVPPPSCTRSPPGVASAGR